MDKKKYKIIKSHILDYLKYLNPNLKINNKGVFECPFKYEHKDEGQDSCNIYPPNSYKLYCFNPAHGKLGDIFDIFRKQEPDMAELSDDEISEYLINILNIQTNDEVDKLFARYHNYGWALLPIEKKGKIAIESKWQKKCHKDILEWKDWNKSGLNIGLNLGSISNALAIDIDHPDTLEKIKDLLGNTLTQTTKRGYHFVYQYDSDFDFVKHVNLRNKGYEMELRANNSYIVIAPSSTEGEKRTWNNIEPQPMPSKLKKFLMDLIEKPKDEKSPDEKIKDAIEKETLNVKNGLKGLDGECNDTFIKLGGVLRKKMGIREVEWSLFNFNKLLDKPMDYKSIHSMCQQLSRYYKYDKEELAKQVLDHLKIIEQATSLDLVGSLKQDKKDIEEVLDYLVKEDKVKKYGRYYKYIKKVDWQTDFMNIGKPLGFEVPVFGKYNEFEDGSMIVLGAKPGMGKTHIACNFINEFVNKDIMPYYVCTEAGSKFKKITAQLGLKEGQYYFKIISDASTIELEDNAVTIIDWLKPKNSDYAKTDTIYENLNDQLVKHGGLLVVFAQLRKNGSFFAPDMIDFYASFVAKYCHSKIVKTNGDVIYDGENTYYSTEKMRDSKIGTQYCKIPMHFNRDTKKLSIRKIK